MEINLNGLYFSKFRTDIRNYTEVDSGVLSDSVLDTIIKNTENAKFIERQILMIIDFMLLHL